jgi:predicted nucleic acid-binding protein
MAVAIVDTGVLVASVDVQAREHQASVRALSTREFDLVIPALCVTEAAYLVERRHGPFVEARFLESLQTFEVVAPEPAEWRRIAELVRQYADFPIGATDASIVALAERLGTDTVMTLDRRHFGAIVPTHCPAFRLLPE